jgi:ribulose-5-phosphate 4-epimerase/fuculose-1-phosphate aldolase
MTSTAAQTTPAASVKSRVSREEWRVRMDLAAFYRLVALHGWNDYIFNHISARVPGPERHYLINPFGLFFDEITASSLVKIDLDGNILLDETGLGVNIGGYVIHGAVHQAREDAHCVAHLHTTEGVAVSTQHDGLLPLNQDALSLIDDVAYHDFEGIALDVDERERLVEHLDNKNLLILRNHGLLTVGATVPLAFTRMRALQKACAIQVATLAGGVKLELPSPAARSKVRHQVGARENQGSGGGVAALAWAGYLRKLGTLDPSYRE